MAQALKRIQKELSDIYKKEDFLEEMGICVGPIDDADMFKWEATIVGPEDTPYESGNFILNIEFPKEYPFRPPVITFQTKIFHVNIHYGYKICCESFGPLYDEWSPDLTIDKILIEIINLLKYPNFQSCNLYGYGGSYANRCYFEKDYKYYK